MATEKQADLIVRLAVKAGKLNPKDSAQCRADVLGLSPADTKRYIDSLNAELGFSRDFSPATDAQRSFVLDLETKVYGTWKTTADARMTYADADQRIKLLTKMLDARTSAPVVDIFTRKAV